MRRLKSGARKGAAVSYLDLMQHRISENFQQEKKQRNRAENKEGESPASPKSLCGWEQKLWRAWKQGRNKLDTKLGAMI